MSEIQKKIENAKQNGYTLDLGEVISQSIENYKKIAMTAGTAVLLISLVFLAILFGIIGIFAGFEDFAANMAGFHVSNFSPVMLLLYIVGTSVIGALMYPMTAGLIKIAHEGEVGRRIDFSMAFDHYKSEYFIKLFTAGLVITFGTNTIGVLFQYLHLDFLGTAFTYIITMFAVFTIPLIIFGKQNAIDSIIISFTLVIKQPFVILIALLISAIIAMLGMIALCIGVFFTIPVIYSTYYILYKNAIGIEHRSEIEEIGVSAEA